MNRLCAADASCLCIRHLAIPRISIAILAMNPIIEEEDSDDFSPRGEAPSLALSTQKVYLPAASPISTDEVLSELSEEVTPSQAVSEASFIPDSVNKWLEFKSIPGRLSDSSTNREAFPVLVRGLEIEASPMRKNSIPHKDSTPKGSFDDSPVKGKGDSSSFSVSASEFLRFDKEEMYESDEEESRTKQEGGLLPSIARAHGPSALDRVLDRQRQGDVAPEDLLLMAISERDNPQAGRRSSIWALLGRSRKPEETITEAIDELKRLRERVVEVAEQKKQTLSEVEELKKNKAELTEKYAELTDTINNLSAKIKASKKSKKAAIDAYARETEAKLAFKSQLFEDRINTLKDTTDQLDSAHESEERWLSRIEELTNILISTHFTHQVAKQESRDFSAIISEIVELRGRLEDTQTETGVCLELLGEVMEYFALANEEMEFNEMLCGLFNRLKETAFEAMDAQKQVMLTATSDPRELLPYKRASEHTVGT